MNTEKLVKMAMAYKSLSMSELAAECGYSLANFSQRLKRDSFNNSDLEKIAKALGARYRRGFEFPDGTKI